MAPAERHRRLSYSVLVVDRLAAVWASSIASSKSQPSTTTRCAILGMMKLDGDVGVGGVVDVRDRPAPCRSATRPSRPARIGLVPSKAGELRLVLQHRAVDRDVEVGVHELGVAEVLEQRLGGVLVLARRRDRAQLRRRSARSMPLGPAGSGEKALPSKSSGSSFLAAMPTEPVLAMKAAWPER